ncbi:hypothetical protein H206_01219 [Candidatus Electrothrix aarhusensis]|uniref:Uncharacterized protein n=1 Tax=Candidatus Electrothrix aarhusensis TaxID=1859131 RepID=A0A444IVQ6_9BACT|nr:hypothetical protein H206_01219 [Candidatus Electrothrix aarhusensis]
MPIPCIDTLEQLAVYVNMSLLNLELVTKCYENHLLQPTAYMELEELCVRMKETLKRRQSGYTKHITQLCSSCDFKSFPKENPPVFPDG